MLGPHTCNKLDQIKTDKEERRHSDWMDTLLAKSKWKERLVQYCILWDEPVSHGYRYVPTLQRKTAPNPLPPLCVPSIFNLTEMRCNQWHAMQYYLRLCLRFSACQYSTEFTPNCQQHSPECNINIPPNYTLVVLAFVTAIDLCLASYSAYSEILLLHTHNHTITHIVNILMHCETMVANDGRGGGGAHESFTFCSAGDETFSLVLFKLQSIVCLTRIDSLMN